MAGKPLSSGKTKTKSQRSADGTRKLAADHGRKKPKAGGEAQKETGTPRGTGRRTGSSKQRKG